MSYYGYEGGYAGYGAGPFANWLDSYATLRLTVTSPAQSFVEPVTLAEAKAFLQIIDGPTAYTAQDNDISAMISAARMVAETFQGRDLVQRSWTRSADYWRSLRLPLRDPLIAVDSFTYKNADGLVTPMVLNTDYIIDYAKSTPILTPPPFKTWPAFYPWPSDAITVVFRSGYAATDPWWKDTGAMVKRAILFLISYWFTSRLPWVKEIGSVDSLPWTVQELLSAGSQVRVP